MRARQHERANHGKSPVRHEPQLAVCDRGTDHQRQHANGPGGHDPGVAMPVKAQPEGHNAER